MARRRKTQGVVAAPVSKRIDEVQNRYDGASSGRRMGSWNAPSTGPNKAISALQVLRNRSRDAVRNEWQAASALRVMVSNLVGTGIIPRPKTTDEALKQKLTALWDEWVQIADADGLLDYYGMQALATRCRREGGEVFVRVRARRPEFGMEVPMQIQLLEPEMCPLLDTDNWPGMSSANKMRQGIEFNRMGQRVAYWFYKEHPGDGYQAIGSNDLFRVSAEYVKHVFKPLRIGQIRGVPEGSVNLAKLRVVTDFDDAVLARQHTANLFTGFVKKNAPTPDGIDPITGKAIETDSEGVPMASLEPGTMQELLPGEDVSFANPPEAGTNYADYMRWQTLGLSSGDGVPYELMTGDLRDISDRALRVILNEFYRFCEQEQWQTIIPGLCTWVREQWVKYALIGGVLTEAEAVEARRVTWSPQRWRYIHPVQDVQARQMEVSEGFRSRSDVVSELGNDVVEVDTERAADQQREIDLGLAFEPVDPNAPPPVDPQTQANVDQTNAQARLLNAKAKRELVEGNATAKRLKAEAARNEAEADMLLARAAQHRAEASLAEARVAMDQSEADARQAALAAAEARANNESVAKVTALEEAAATAREEADRQAAAHAEAQTFLAEQRELVLKAERTRAEVAALEREAAELGLAELKGDE